MFCKRLMEGEGSLTICDLRFAWHLTSLPVRGGRPPRHRGDGAVRVPARERAGGGARLAGAGMLRRDPKKSDSNEAPYP